MENFPNFVFGPTSSLIYNSISNPLTSTPAGIIGLLGPGLALGLKLKVDNVGGFLNCSSSILTSVRSIPNYAFDVRSHLK